jgi:hypothetical protein
MFSALRTRTVLAVVNSCVNGANAGKVAPLDDLHGFALHIVLKSKQMRQLAEH